MESRSGKEHEFTHTSEENQPSGTTYEEDQEKTPRLSFINSDNERSMPIAENVHSDVESNSITMVMKTTNEDSNRKERLFDPNNFNLAMEFTNAKIDVSTNMKYSYGEFDSNKSIKDKKNKKKRPTKLHIQSYNLGLKEEDQVREYTRILYHTIICIDTSKSMRASKQTTNSCIHQLLREIPERSPEFEEIISVVCFGKYLRVYQHVFENPTGHIQFITDELENQFRSWIGCTPLYDACRACIAVHSTIEGVIRRVGIPVFLKGRIVMFTDGKCTSTSVRQDVDDENYNPMESMDIIHNNLNNVWIMCREGNLPIFCIISSYHNTDQNFLVTMSISTNGKILLQDEISTFAKFIDIEIKADLLRMDCRNFNWHQVFAYLRLNIGHQDMLYYDYATELILRMNNENVSFCNHNGLPRLIRRYPKQGIFAWQERNQLRDWVYFLTEMSDEIEKGYCNRQQRHLDTFTIERQNDQVVEVLRFDFKSFSYRIIGDQSSLIDIRRTFIGNDWG